MTTRQDTGAEPVATSEAAAGEAERGAAGSDATTGATTAGDQKQDDDDDERCPRCGAVDYCPDPTCGDEPVDPNAWKPRKFA